MKNAICLLLFLVGALVPIAAMGGQVLSEVDLDRLFLDGVQLTGNWNVRYLNADTVGIRVQNRSAGQASWLVDGVRMVPRQGAPASGLTWLKDETADITIDLGGRKLISGIAITREGDAQWQIATSADAQTWAAVPLDHVVEAPQHILVLSLARIARYVSIRAEAGSPSLSINEVFVYGERNPPFDIIGGVYASTFPPVANEDITLRAVIRNPTDRAVKSLTVEFESLAPDRRKLGECTLDSIAPKTAAIAAISWKPTVSEPHTIRVRVRDDEKEKTLPVVNRRLYLGSASPPDYERFRYINLFTGIGRDYAGLYIDAPQYLLTKLHGAIPLATCWGPHPSGNIGLENFKKNWSKTLHSPFRDGMAMDEWGEPYPEALEALKRIYRKKGETLIAPWLAGGITGAYVEGFRFADLILIETYCNMMGHDIYRSYVNSAVDRTRKAGLLERSLIALGFFTNRKPTVPEELEREVRHVRLRGPEMPGIVFYTSTWRKQRDDQWDELAYRYFISPVIMPKDIRIQKSTVTLNLANIGGMNAHDVKVGVFSAEGKTLSSKTMPLIPAGKALSASLPVKEGTVSPQVRVIPSEGYTVLAPKPLEVLPPEQVVGNPIQVCWTPDDGKLNPADYLEFVNRATGQASLVLKNLGDRGKWDNDGNFYVKNIKTDGLDVGRYLVRLLDGEKAILKGSDELAITSAGGEFFVSKVNGKPWTGDPQNINLKAGDAFEVSWDLTGRHIPSPVIFITPPGESDLRMPAPDRGYAFADITRIMFLVKDPEGDPLVKGS